MLSLSDIRSRFPALSRLAHGHPVAYFDGPGGTQVPREVGEAMTDYLYYHNANTHWEYPTSQETDARLHAARVAAGDLLNAAPEEISFGNNMTTIAFHVAHALGRGWGAGDEVIVTELDHHANVAPWREMAKDRGMVVRTVRMDPVSGTLDWDDLRRAFTGRTRLLAIGAASNALGTITDVAAATRLAHDAGALTFVDAVHYAAHGVIDVQAWDCDFLACSSYKFYGPHAGVFYGRRSLVDALPIAKLDPAPNDSPERVESGTQNHEAIVGIGAAVDFLASLSAGDASWSRRRRLTRALGALHDRGDAQIARLWRGLEAIDGVTLYGITPGNGPRTPTLIFTVAGHTSTAVARALAPRGIYASNGDFYAVTVIERIGQSADGVVRAGCACYTTDEEVDRLIAGVAEIARS
ncbi:MAG: cysteine desulfurase-like protein [Gemmatimonadota bacterium]